ncbi:MAG: STAS domain-containing protein [Candidatus Binatia bacterium]
MELEQTNAGHVVVIKALEKRLDARTALEFKDHMTQVIKAGHRQFVLDISEVDFIDSSGLGAIVSSLKALAGCGDLVIAGARDTVMSMFKLTRIDRVFRMFATAAEAVVALS